MVICEYPGLVIPELGVGGYSPGPHLAFVAVEPENPTFRDWVRTIPATIAHELHHVARWRGPGYGTTLLDSLVSEGLTCLYENEFSGALPVYAKNLGIDLNQLWADAVPDLDRADLHTSWFFDVPHGRWAGYVLGTELCRRYLDRAGLSAAEAVHVDAPVFADSW